MNTAATLRRLLAENRPVQAMATHSPLSARLAEEAGFEALWASGFELSALYGLPDMSLISMTDHLNMMRAITGQVAVPVIADIDTGFGNAVNVAHAVREYDRAGAAAVVIEDKTFPKVTSLVGDGRQELVSTAEFCGKVSAAIAHRGERGLVVIARTEALIAGLGQDEALARAHAYADAGADLILVHSKQKTAAEIEAFVAEWNGKIPLAIVPTAYPEMTLGRIRSLGKIGLVIWGNHALRAAVTGMRQAFTRIIADQGIESVEQDIVPVSEIFRLQQMDKVKAFESQYLR